MKRSVTCGEKWILYSPILHSKKIMVNVWWCKVGIIKTSLLKRAYTINADKYCTQLETMHQKFRLMRPRLIKSNEALLLRDNVSDNTNTVSRRTIEKLRNFHYETLPLPQYSLDLLSTDYHFFEHLNDFLAWKSFNNETAIKKHLWGVFSVQNVRFPCNWYTCSGILMGKIYCIQ